MDIKEINKSVLITKVSNETGEIEAYVTTYGNKDVVDDVVMKGALDDFITKFNKGETDTVRLLLNHDRSLILGKWTKFESDAHGVKGTAKFSDVTQGRDVKTLIKDGILGSVSIGFKATDYDFNEDGGLDFNKIELIETSVVDRPANSKAKITSVKSEDGLINPRALEKTLREAGLSKGEAQGIVRIAQEQFKFQCEAEDETKSIVQALSSFNLGDK